VSAAAEPLRVLIIEDNPGDALLVGEALRGRPEAAVEVAVASRLDEGLARLARDGVDVVVLDLLLPDANGLEGLDRLAAVAPDVAIVVLTGLDNEATALDALRRRPRTSSPRVASRRTSSGSSATPSSASGPSGRSARRRTSSGRSARPWPRSSAATTGARRPRSSSEAASG
jgi:CheY-like chemotaxis protein